MELINQLKQFDNLKGYRIPYNQLKKKIQPVIAKLIEKKPLDELHSLLLREETWSCLFALEMLKEIKSPKSIPFLIEFLIKTDDSDYWEAGENAMLALQNIGKPSIGPVLAEIRRLFSEKTFIIYLIGALTKIKDDSVFQFMKEITEDYIDNLEKYKDWFLIDCFVTDFDRQEALPLLKKLIEMPHLNEQELIEIKDVIQQIEYPEGYEKEIKQMEEGKKLDGKIKKNLGGIGFKV